ncbi:MAG: hypothetical protein RLZZ507_975 [Cyanobacteriota bacterium]|jgi:acetyltransferase-like isoleucine patch superfamily enzyme
MSLPGHLYRFARFKIFSKNNIKFKHLNVGIPLTAKLITGPSSSITFEDRIDLGRYVLIHANNNCHVKIGHEVYIGDFSSIIAAECEVTIGKSTIIAQYVKLIGINHAYIAKDKTIQEQYMDMTKKGITIGEDCWIGAGACILPGVKIGDGAVIGAMAVVTKDVEPYTVVAGNPAKVIKTRQ